MKNLNTDNERSYFDLQIVALVVILLIVNKIKV